VRGHAADNNRNNSQYSKREKSLSINRGDPVKRLSIAEERPPTVSIANFAAAPSVLLRS